MIPIEHTFVLSIFLFSIGMMGVLARRNAIIILMSIELMINAVNVNFISFSRYLSSMDGLIFVLFIIAVEAAELAVGLAIIINCYRHKGAINTHLFSLLKG